MINTPYKWTRVSRLKVKDEIKDSSQRPWIMTCLVSEMDYCLVNVGEYLSQKLEPGVSYIDYEKTIPL